MREGRRPSARFKARVEDTSESEQAGRHAGEQDAAELDDLDSEAAWLTRLDNGGPDSPAHYAAFTAAYEAGYDFTISRPQPAEQVPDAV
jgi:hypothetical protein